jgi:hypothetical protein
VVPAGRALLEDQVPGLLAALGRAATLGATGAVRETALRCILACLDLPYAALHPHRNLVLPAITSALDDRKRAVRLQAARTRRAWIPL